MTTDAPETIRVLLVDDDGLVRAGLKMILGGASDVDVVGEAGHGEEAIALTERLSPDVVLMDIRMPRLDGIAATDRLVSTYGDRVRVIVLTTFDTDDMIVRAVQVGASGFLLKDTPPERLVAAVRTVAAGDPILSPQVTASLMARIGSTGDDDRVHRARARLAVLTEREHEVALAVGKGWSNAEISRELYMSVPTVKAHVSRLLTKLDAANRVQIALLVHDARLA
ncbi:response regulator transcription factor [Luteipulveratus sp. YIM 133132]|uniref:Response regulator transcription factor n=1 Tax=Luteipulveratus flavus TaxID=3031728 RepID=A0ABT6C6V8_9MICO|nr:MULTISPECIES: response regulator transcription factor [unclassified Luteipulveratus]MDE9366427.1 response regulator transcription factor [Luteipulveratus sp. YIM 133132]MDF8264298.1 response regulator transcription factor [Luteipulveratus sp. YIM 133296]